MKARAWPVCQRRAARCAAPPITGTSQTSEHRPSAGAEHPADREFFLRAVLLKIGAGGPEPRLRPDPRPFIARSQLDDSRAIAMMT